MRGELLRFTNGAALINDCYNSSPAALHAMIDLLAATPNYQRRILAAGEMRELGATAAEFHRRAGSFAARTGKIDWVIGVAGDAAKIVEEAAKFLEQFIVPGDLLLVKGSRGVKMERIVEALFTRYASPGENTHEEVRH
jgi:UDP-N-acetylmuramoyl-tripeptide--D-alanyl-D-alanine ligase